MTGLALTAEALDEGRKQGVRFVFLGLLSELEVRFKKFGITADMIVEDIGDELAKMDT